jgi:hypothetical protein
MGSHAPTGLPAAGAEGYPAGTMRMSVGQSRHFLVFPVRPADLVAGPS